MEKTQEGLLVRPSETHPHVMELIMDRSDALNAISVAQARALAAAARDVAEDPYTRAVVLMSACDRAFSVGADLKERSSASDEELAATRPVSREAYRAVLEIPVPAVAAVHGYSLGGGLELALSCDLIVVDETAVLGLPEVTVGVIPGGGGTQLLPRRIGWSRAADLIYTGRRIDAREAMHLGIADRLAPAGQAGEMAAELAGRIARNSPAGVRNAKRAMRLGAGLDLPAALEVEDSCWRATAFSADRREGVAAFAEKRRPSWPAP